MAAVRESKTLRTELDYVNYIWHNHVIIDDDNRKMSKAVVNAVVDDILEYFKDHSKLFRGDKICIGSAYQGLKIGEANEYDYNIPLYLSSVSPPIAYEEGDFIGCYGFNAAYQSQEMTLAAIPDDCTVIARRHDPLPKPVELGKGFYFVSSVEPKDQERMAAEEVVFDLDIIPYLLRRRLHKLLQQSVEHVNLKG